jgi:hypothetical protein
VSRERHFCSAVFLVDTMAAALLPQVLAKQLPVPWIDQPNL